MATAPAFVRDFMTPNPITIAPEASVETVVKVLEENQVGGLPVVDPEGKVIGIISEGDLLYQEAPMQPPLYLTFLGSVIYFESPDKFHQHIRKALGMMVRDVMTPNPITTNPNTAIADVAQLMLENASAACRWWMKTISWWELSPAMI